MQVRKLFEVFSHMELRQTLNAACRRGHEILTEPHASRENEHQSINPRADMAKVVKAERQPQSLSLQLPKTSLSLKNGQQFSLDVINFFKRGNCALIKQHLKPMITWVTAQETIAVHVYCLPTCYPFLQLTPHLSLHPHALTLDPRVLCLFKHSHQSQLLGFLRGPEKRE